ncbi:MAG: tRNA (guanine-N1)-methyltransferase [Cyanobacteria bacterium QS_8_64_29]|nr:MAG: tRNA (guanine-N1)-methyltransferase [Cyanobacteria bacterium QS_8_64_29]
MVSDASWVGEGQAQFQIGNAFYRTHSIVARDLAVLVGALHKADTGSLRVLDAMAGCGVRCLRYYLESGADALWANDADPDVAPTLRQNLARTIASERWRTSYEQANRVFFECHNRKDYYDLVDVDNFGSPDRHINTLLWAVRIGGYAYLTSTDGRSATGRIPDKSLSVFGAYARAHPAAHEQGLRLMLGSLQQQSSRQNLGIVPVFSLFTRETYRTMVRLVTERDLSGRNFAFLGYCHQCGNYRTVGWRELGQASCSHDGAALAVSGPMWLGALHERSFVARMRELAYAWSWRKRARLLATMAREATMPPYFHSFQEIGRRGNLSLPKRDALLRQLQARGYRASETHLNAQAIKTDADMATCIAIARQG